MPLSRTSYDSDTLRAYRERQIDDDTRKAAGLEPVKHLRAFFYLRLVGIAFGIVAFALYVFERGGHTAP